MEPFNLRCTCSYGQKRNQRTIAPSGIYPYPTCCRRQQHLWSHRNPYSRPEADIFSCGRRPQVFLSHMSRPKSGRKVTIWKGFSVPSKNDGLFSPQTLTSYTRKWMSLASVMWFWNMWPLPEAGAIKDVRTFV